MSNERLRKYLYSGPNVAPRSLQNFSGVACWWNSLLQYIQSIPLIYDILKQQPKLNELALKYIQFVDNRASHVELFNKFTELAPDLDRGQQCSREGFERFIDKLDCKDVEECIYVGIRKVLECPSCGGNNGIDTSKAATRTNNLVYNYYYQPNIRDENSFTDFIRRHDYHLEWKCENKQCVKHNQLQQIEASDVLRRVNNVMCFHMNKYSAIKPLQFFPEKFEIPVLNSNLKYKYKLVATTEHSGGVSGGHYQARGRRLDVGMGGGLNTESQPYWFDDSAQPIKCDFRPKITTVMLAYVMVDISQ